jgi:hypothetical protein
LDIFQYNNDTEVYLEAFTQRGLGAAVHPAHPDQTLLQTHTHKHTLNNALKALVIIHMINTNRTSLTIMPASFCLVCDSRQSKRKDTIIPLMLADTLIHV